MKPESMVVQDAMTGERHRLAWQPGGLVSRTPIAAALEPEWWLAPPLFDVQINGFAGVDFQQDDPGESDLLRAVRGLRAAGCTRFLPTLITDDWPRFTRRLRAFKRCRDDCVELRRAMVGWHLEGPFLSDQPGYHGAHDPALMLDPRPEHLRELRAIVGTDPLLLTLAPERTGAIEAIRIARQLGFVVSLGHTNASAAVLAEAVAAGASGFTHLGNACPQNLDRHDNILWRVLETAGLHVSLIPDGLHVAPPLFRLLHRLLPAEAVLYTTDAMSAAGSPPGRYRLGGWMLDVGDDGVVRQPGGSNFAGSSLTPVAGVFRAATALKEEWTRSWRRFSQTPAHWLRMSSVVAPERLTDFCLVNVTLAGALAGLRVFVAGEEFVHGREHLVDGK